MPELTDPVGYVVEFSIDDLPMLPNKAKGLHWSHVSRDRKRWHQLVRVAVGRQAPISPFPHAHVVLVRRSASQPDPDNLMASWKPVVDGLVRAKVLVDDKAENVTLDSRWDSAPRGKGRISVRVVSG